MRTRVRGRPSGTAFTERVRERSNFILFAELSQDIEILCACLAEEGKQAREAERRARRISLHCACKCNFTDDIPVQRAHPSTCLCVSDETSVNFTR